MWASFQEAVIQFLGDILLAMVGTAALLAVAGFLGKSLFEQYLRKKVIEFQDELGRRNRQIARQEENEFCLYSLATKALFRISSQSDNSYSAVESYLQYFNQNKITLSGANVIQISPLNAEIRSSMNDLKECITKNKEKFYLRPMTREEFGSLAEKDKEARLKCDDLYGKLSNLFEEIVNVIEKNHRKHS